MRLNTVPFLTFICILSISSLGCDNTPEEPQIILTAQMRGLNS